MKEASILPVFVERQYNMVCYFALRCVYVKIDRLILNKIKEWK